MQACIAVCIIDAHDEQRSCIVHREHQPRSKRARYRKSRGLPTRVLVCFFRTDWSNTGEGTNVGGGATWKILSRAFRRWGIKHPSTPFSPLRRYRDRKTTAPLCQDHDFYGTFLLFDFFPFHFFWKSYGLILDRKLREVQVCHVPGFFTLRAKKEGTKK